MKDWLWFKRIQIEYWWYNFKSRCTKRRHCDKGFHKVHTGWTETTNHKGETIHSNHIHCPYCETYYFPTKEDKANYLRIKEQENEMYKKFFNSVYGKKPTVKVFNGK